MQPKVFISYRREDCLMHARLLAENLQSKVGANVFLDLESIAPGAHFPDAIEEQIAASDLVLVLIGDDWHSVSGPDGAPRINDPDDWVHREIAAALTREALTIPVLVEGELMQLGASLPTAIAPLATRNAVELRDIQWAHDFLLIEQVVRKLAPRTAEEPTAGAVEFPARFTDRWFSEQVPGFDEAQMTLLVAELGRRNWSPEEIAERVEPYASSSPTRLTPGAAPGHDTNDPPGPATRVDSKSDPVAAVLADAAQELEELDRSGHPVRERDLANALGAHLRRAQVERRLDVPGWNPMPGNLDVFTTDWLGRTQLVIETKLKDATRSSSASGTR